MYLTTGCVDQITGTQLKILRINKKAFQSNANRPLADSVDYIVNKFEHIWKEEGRDGALYRYPL